MSQATARPSVVKSTYKHLSEVLSAYWSGDRKGHSLINTLHGSPRLSQWAKVADGYRIWSIDEAMSITVTPEKIYTTKGIRVDDIQNGLPAQTLFNVIQTAQVIVQSNGAIENEEDYFAPGEGFASGASLDAALEETSVKPLDEDDAELIEDVISEKPAAPEPVYKSAVSYGTASVVAELDDTELVKEAAPGYTAKTNQKNTKIDGVPCPYCGNFNHVALRGVCPQCPKELKNLPEPKDEPVKECPKTENTLVIARLKSLQGRVLNIMEASFSDKSQREAVKTLINKEFRREMNRVGSGWSRDEE